MASKVHEHESLVLYKFHSKDCVVHKSRIPVANRRYWMECDCWIWIVGRTPSGAVVPRQTTKCRTLKEAQAVRLALMQEAPKDDAGILITDAIAKYLASRDHELGSRTNGQYGQVLRRFQEFCSKRATLHMKDLTIDLLEDFKVEGLPKTMRDTSKGTVVAKVRCFLRDAFRRGWIKEALADRTKPHRAVYEQKEPYTEKEIEIILEAAGNLDGGTHGYASKPATFRLLLELMLETGMRVGDAVQFDPSVLSRGEHMWIYPFEMGKKKKTAKVTIHEAYLSDRLKTAIDNCEWMSKRKPFWYATRDYALEQLVYERMQVIGRKNGVNDCRPHRLRDSFAVRKLLAGLQLDDVSRLLGHSSVKVTEQYYARWIKARRVRLERLVSESLVNA